jgi:hypothetical protein
MEITIMSMDEGYVKQLEATIEELSRKVDALSVENEKILEHSKAAQRYQPTFKPYLRGYILCVDRAVIARAEREDVVNGGEFSHYNLFICGENVGRFSKMEDVKKVVEVWLKTGWNGLPAGG